MVKHLSKYSKLKYSITFFIMIGTIQLIIGFFFYGNVKWWLLYLGLDALIVGLGDLFIYIYYVLTNFKLESHSLNITLISIWFISVTQIIFSIVLAFFSPDVKRRWVGYVGIIYFILIITFSYFAIYYRDKLEDRKLVELKNKLDSGLKS